MPKHSRISNDLARQRLFLIQKAKQIGVSQACLLFGKHRSYYYRWAKRYQDSGGNWKSVINQSTKPKHSPKISSKQTVDLVCQIRKKTNYGQERIAFILRQKGHNIPSSTIGNILNREG